MLHREKSTGTPQCAWFRTPLAARSSRPFAPPVHPSHSTQTPREAVLFYGRRQPARDWETDEDTSSRGAVSHAACSCLDNTFCELTTARFDSLIPRWTLRDEKEPASVVCSSPSLRNDRASRVHADSPQRAERGLRADHSSGRRLQRECVFTARVVCADLRAPSLAFFLADSADGCSQSQKAWPDARARAIVSASLRMSKHCV